ncbi:unnamed protein product [Didymodactylos carnosus]|uniref:MSP domain-containing protein n=1 Tax=Didymodactylos carnosus TaxID=1234261 RepID=A0A813PIR4_9BILA|nr:unnamed protein product [Didymodactylos carnosus]CAF0749448.1 unnamed protein product [Didymodactylos carnosus]CAF3493338.1 unnamed protein product [Didymodactylos carnosus]CAF3528777.1 unnamed protein product [Didymodactylos carnosus]
MTLELNPSTDLVFKGPFNNVSTTMLKLSNSGHERLAYKIKTTAPKRYCVKPNSGFLDPSASTNIQVMLQPQSAGGQHDERAKHKFMVQWVAVPPTWTDDVDNFWKQDVPKLNVQDSKLKCVFADDQSVADRNVPNDSFRHPDGDVSGSTYGDKVLNTQSQIENHVIDKTYHNANHTEATSTNQRSTTPFQQQQTLSATTHRDRQDGGDESNKQRLKQELDRLKEENENLKEKMNVRSRKNFAGDGMNQVDNSTLHGHNQQQQKLITLFGINLSERMIIIAFIIALIVGFSLGNITMILKKNSDLFSTNVIEFGNETVPVDRDIFYDGYVEGQRNSSYVCGAFYSSWFDGLIKYSNSTTYYIEPSLKYNSSIQGVSIIYDTKDVTKLDKNLMRIKNLATGKIKKTILELLNNTYTNMSRRKRQLNNPCCSMFIRTDKTLWDQYYSDVGLRKFWRRHDDNLCPGDQDGNYIMFAHAVDGLAKNNNKFSRCSLHNMSRTIVSITLGLSQTKKSCFLACDKIAFCGNGIVDGNEECDCGYPDECTEQCCYPAETIINGYQMGCKRKPGAICRNAAEVFVLSRAYRSVK